MGRNDQALVSLLSSVAGGAAQEDLGLGAKAMAELKVPVVGGCQPLHSSQLSDKFFKKEKLRRGTSRAATVWKVGKKEKENERTSAGISPLNKRVPEREERK